MITKQMKHNAYSIAAFLLLGLGISLQIKAGIGQSMLNAFVLTVAELFRLEAGTTLNIMNTLFFITYLFLRKAPINYKDAIQIASTILSGYVINIFLYHVLADIVIEAYILKVLVFLLGLGLASISLGAVLAIDIIKFPLESLCIVLGQKLGMSLTTVRMRFDMVFLLGTLVIAIIFGSTLYIREGTVVSFLLLSRLMGLAYYFFRNYIGLLY